MFLFTPRCHVDVAAIFILVGRFYAARRGTDPVTTKGLRPADDANPLHFGKGACTIGDAIAFDSGSTLPKKLVRRCLLGAELSRYALPPQFLVIFHDSMTGG